MNFCCNSLINSFKTREEPNHTPIHRKVIPNETKFCCLLAWYAGTILRYILWLDLQYRFLLPSDCQISTQDRRIHLACTHHINKMKKPIENPFFYLLLQEDFKENWIWTTNADWIES